MSNMPEHIDQSELLKTDVHSLIPQAVIKAARNPDNLDILPIRTSRENLNFMVVEHNYGLQTDEHAWQEWEQQIHEVETQHRSEDLIILPDAPPEVNRLHARFRLDIEQGRLSFLDRIMLVCQMVIKNEKEPVLYIGEYDGEEGLGIATEFYTETLPKLAKKLNIHIITGLNNGDNLAFYTEKLGRYTYRQLKPEYQQSLFPDVNPLSNIGDYITVQFIYPEDISKYIQPEHIKK